MAVTPTQATINTGQSIQFRASVGGDSTAPVVWRIADTTIATIAVTGMVQSISCHRPGATTVIASVPGNPTQNDSAALIVVVPATSPFSISGIYRAGTDGPVDIDHIDGTVDVAVSTFPLSHCPDPGLAVDSIVVSVANGSGTLRIGKIPGFSFVPRQPPRRLEWNSAEGTGATPAFPNGDYVMSADGYILGRSLPSVSNSVPIRISNP